MMNGKYQLYTSKEVKPTGWLKRQLEIQAQGLSGHLDQVWPDVRDSAWIGGNSDGWERVPYWLDGFIPLAYLLQDEDMIARAQKYVQAIVAKQKADGWICPCADEERASYDTWAVELISKVLTVYYDCSGDESILQVVYRTMKNYYDMLSAGTIQLYNWAKSRWFEAFIALNRLWQIYHEEWIRDLAKILKEQGLDYAACKERWVRPLNQWHHETHIVNIAMMLKQDAVSCDLLGKAYSGLTDELYDILDTYNGRPVGVFTGDECLAGVGAIQGTELCSVVELMYSYELLYAYTGDPRWAERLELAAFNALPGTLSDDMWSHQYDQLTNQISCERYKGKAFFRTNGAESYIFGLEPNYGCCTANFNQGWPKLALSVFMHDEQGILAALPLPASLRTRVGNVPVSIDCTSEYPFKNTMRYTIRVDGPVHFSFRVRIPSFAKQVRVNGKAVANQGMICVEKTFEGQTEILLSFETLPRVTRNRSGLYSVKCGSLVFSLPIQAEWIQEEYIQREVERKFPYCDYQLKPLSDWSYGFASREFTVERHEVAEVPFSSEKPAVTLKAKLAPIDWGLLDGYTVVCDTLPQSTKAKGEARELELYPYGSTKLRMTELPFISKTAKKD